jgi:hypothetical protein
MAFGLIVRKTLKSGQVVYKRGNRRVSASAYRSQQWRLRGGKAGTAKRASIKAETERLIRSDWGAPPAGWTWVKIADKYPDRFEGYTEDFEDRFL